jgi:hypothetical protein
MSTLRVNLEAPRRGTVPADLLIAATITNAGDAPVPFHRYLAEHGSMMLQVEDASGLRIPLLPPSPPDERDLAAPTDLAPGESVSIRYAGFLDTYQRAGRYRVRWFSPHEALGATRDSPLSSDWIDVDLLDPRKSSPLDWIGSGVRYVVALAKWLIDLVLRRVCRAVVQKEVDHYITETITNGTPASWNNTYAWNARFHVRLDQPQQRIDVTIRIRMVSGSPGPAWVNVVENAWSNRFKDCATIGCASNGYPIYLKLQYVASGEHHALRLASGRTEHMLSWGLVDNDQAHEAGHMLGNKEEYFTIDGVDFGQPHQPGGNIMNNPANPPVAKHYWLIQTTVDAMLGVNYSLAGGSTRALNVPCSFS